MNVRLVVRQGGQRRTLHLRGAEAVVGRARGSTVRIPSGEVSRQHCRLWQEGGLLFAEDLRSLNGTLLNGRPLRGREVVRPGDTLGVGPVVFAVEYEPLRPAAPARAEVIEAELLEDEPADAGFAEVVLDEEDPDLAAAALEPLELEFELESWEGPGEDEPPTQRGLGPRR